MLKDRAMNGDKRKGSTNADVLYMFMPGPLFQWQDKNDQIKGLNAYKNDRTQPSLRHGATSKAFVNI